MIENLSRVVLKASKDMAKILGGMSIGCDKGKYIFNTKWE